MTALRITQRRSKNGASKRQRQTLRSLGLKRIGHSVEHEDTAQVRGMVGRVKHLVDVADDG